jgi:serine/threonine protein kinase
MVAIIKSDPYKRYKAIKIIFQTPLVAKCVVARRDSGASYVMVIAPTKDKSGNPNQVKDRVTNLLELDHPGVVRVFEAYEFDGYCYAIMNDWTEFNHGAFGLTTLTEEQVATSIHKMTASLSYLQEMDIILGCISIEEMRFTRYLEDVENDYVDILIIDLGISRHVDPKRYVELHQNRRYAEPPEARDGVFTKYSDVWTLGSITYHLLTGDVSTEHLLERIHFNLEERLQDVSRDARNFCLSCLKVVPEERLSLKEAMNHPWFQKYRIKLRKSIVASKSTSKLLSDISNSEENERTGTNFMKRASKVRTAAKYHVLMSRFGDV